MYWNINLEVITWIIRIDKLQHEMYWNLYKVFYILCLIQDKLQHEMYWNSYVAKYPWRKRDDKLQHETYWNTGNLTKREISIAINYNMRCIETKELFLLFQCQNKINYNMRCIETIIRTNPRFSTYDKLQHEMYWNYGSAKEICFFSSW